MDIDKQEAPWWVTILAMAAIALLLAGVLWILGAWMSADMLGGGGPP